jgi:hypothetical protein
MELVGVFSCVLDKVVSAFYYIMSLLGDKNPESCFASTYDPNLRKKLRELWTCLCYSIVYSSVDD